MKKKELLEKWPAIEDKLETSDILLFHKRKGPITTRVQRESGSHWSHSALVFLPKKKMPIGGPLIVEATFGGIEIHQLKKYTDHFDEYDIGVLRYPKLTEVQRTKFVKAFILNSIDIPYDYSRLIGFVFRPILTRISPRLSLWVAKKVTHETNFVCSTFVHKAFHRLRDYKELEPEDILDSDERGEYLQKEEMYTPGDLANSKIFKWVFNKRLKYEEKER